MLLPQIARNILCSVGFSCVIRNATMELEDINPKDIGVILISPKTYEKLGKFINKEESHSMSYLGIPIQYSNIPKDNEFMVIPREALTHKYADNIIEQLKRLFVRNVGSQK